MISNKSFQREWILQVVKEKFPKTDPGLAEKVIHALALLEKLKASGVDFIFKGGTALLLSLKSLNRFSIDIDIIMPAKPKNLDTLLQTIGTGAFTGYEIDARENKLAVEKGHYRFAFDSKFNPLPQEIILDVIFDTPTYIKTRKLPLISPFVQSEGNFLEITVPTLEGLLSDKLSTLASGTIGIPFGQGRELQIAKQLYDVARLFDEVTDLRLVRSELERLVPVEAGYKKIANPGIEVVLRDCFEFALVVGLRGQRESERHEEIRSGVTILKNFLVKKGPDVDAIAWAGKLAYMSRILLGAPPEKIPRYSAGTDMRDWQITVLEYTKLNKIKRSSPEGFFYWHHALKI
jgi:predicted nucleotidyltransferase component of viral defense system